MTPQGSHPSPSDSPTREQAMKAVAEAMRPLADAARTMTDALIAIRDQDPIENALDPQWAARVAAHALTQVREWTG